MEFQELFKSLPRDVNLLAVSKGQAAEKIIQLASLGQVDFGESRVQEALLKIDTLNYLSNIRWHFIGNLQANKVRLVVKKFDFIHSLDSLKLAKRVSRIAGEENRKPKVMAQVKFRDDPDKFGFNSNELLEVWDEFLGLPNIDLVGLMTISPISLKLDQRKILFKECRSFANTLGLKDCSMGMSGDWQEAIEAGATWIRLGSCLFGGRPVS